MSRARRPQSRLIGGSLVFTPWTPWAERASLPVVHKPGLYVVARFPKQPPARVNPLSRAILYIGITRKQTFHTRWLQFHRSAVGGVGHSGGITFHRKFGASTEQLYVAALTVHAKGPRRSALIALLERALLWEYVKRFRRYPPCNQE